MKPAAFAFFRPQSIDEAVELLALLGEDARPIAAGKAWCRP